MRSNVIQFPRPYSLNPYAGMPRFPQPFAISKMAGYGQVPPSGEAYADWVEQQFTTDHVFATEEVDAAMDRVWADAVSRGLVESNWYFAGAEAIQDPSSGLWAIKVYYYVPPEMVKKKGMPWYGWLGIGLGGVAVITTVVLIARRRKRR